jgi:predicted ATPase
MTNKGAADYSALARHMDVIYVAEVPTMSVLDHDRSRRFITLVDEVYDAEKRLKWTCAKEVADLFSFITEEVSGALCGSQLCCFSAAAH